jgi:hypothetical protein
MSDFKNLLDRFEDHEDNLKKLGDALVERYPQSKNLIQLSQELGSAIDGLGALKNRLSDAISEAEKQAALGADIADQMGKSEIYQNLSDRDRQKLSEYLVQNEAGLASDEELEAFVKKSLEQKSDQDLLAEFSKPHIMELGHALIPEADEFESYKEGSEALLQEIADPEKKAQLVNDLAKVLIKESPATIVKLFFNQAFKQDEVEVPTPKPSIPETPASEEGAEVEETKPEIEPEAEDNG